MSGFEIAVFIHLLGVLALFAAATLSHVAGARMRKAETVEQVRDWVGLQGMLSPIFPISAVVIFGAGAYMVGDLAFFDWDDAWISVGIATLLFAVTMGGVVGERAMKSVATAAAAAPSGPVPVSLRRLLLDPVRLAVENTLTLLIVALVYMMVDKPNLAGAVASVLVAVAVGALSSVPARKRQQAAMAALEPAE